VALSSPTPTQYGALCRHRLCIFAFRIWILNGINWPSFTVEVGGIATLIYIDRLLAKMFGSVTCIYHVLPIWRASHTHDTLIPFNDDSAAVVFFCLLQLRPAGTIMVFQPGLAMILALRDNFESDCRSSSSFLPLPAVKAQSLTLLPPCFNLQSVMLILLAASSQLNFRLAST